MSAREGGGAEGMRDVTRALGAERAGRGTREATDAALLALHAAVRTQRCYQCGGSVDPVFVVEPPAPAVSEAMVEAATEYAFEHFQALPRAWVRGMLAAALARPADARGAETLERRETRRRALEVLDEAEERRAAPARAAALPVQSAIGPSLDICQHSRIREMCEVCTPPARAAGDEDAGSVDAAFAWLREEGKQNVHASVVRGVIEGLKAGAASEGRRLGAELAASEAARERAERELAGIRAICAAMGSSDERWSTERCVRDLAQGYDAYRSDAARAAAGGDKDGSR